MYQSIIKFWFTETNSSLWWSRNAEFDKLITDRFSDLHRQACNCELYPWREDPHGRLAEIIILDQFSRNMFRDSPRAFSQDSLALALSQAAIAVGGDDALTPVERSFLYMPFMHSESLKIHEWAEELFRKNGIQNNLDYELKHKEIIERFGRYPHRNQILGRESTAEELEFLKHPGSGF